MGWTGRVPRELRLRRDIAGLGGDFLEDFQVEE
jgi:hypothetical protein